MTRAVEKSQAVTRYSELLRAVRKAISEGKLRAMKAVEREKVRTCWGVGKLICDHILLKKDRADYGAYVIHRLSKDLGVSLSELHSMVEFAQAYPILLPGGELSWSHYKALLAVNDKATRDKIAVQAEAGDWSKRELRAKIRKLKKEKKGSVRALPLPAPLVAKPGILHTYRIVERGGERKIDLGFSCYLALNGALKRQGLSPGRVGRWTVPFRAGDIVSAKNHGRGKLARSSASENDLFTYEVTVLDVTDGDTFWALVDLGFGVSTKQQLRLRAIDAPEMNTRAGIRARNYLAKKLRRGSKIMIATTKSDKYDRYLADVWAGETYLNEELVRKGYAVIVAG